MTCQILQQRWITESDLWMDPFPSHYVFPWYLFFLSSLQDEFESLHFNFSKHSKVLLWQINDDFLSSSLPFIQSVYPSFSSQMVRGSFVILHSYQILSEKNLTFTILNSSFSPELVTKSCSQKSASPSPSTLGTTGAQPQAQDGAGLGSALKTHSPGITSIAVLTFWRLTSKAFRILSQWG